MKTAVKKGTRCFAFWISVILLAVSIAGCDSPEKTELSFADFSKEQQTFTYPGIPWGADVHEVEKALGCTFHADSGEIKENSNDTTSITKKFYGENIVSFYGLPCNSEYQFKDGQLQAASLSYANSLNGNENFEKLLKEARNAFGKETEAKINESAEVKYGSQTLYAHFSEYTWEQKNADGETTRARLTANLENTFVRFITFDVSKISNDK